MSRYTEPDWSRSALITIDIQNDNSLIGSKAEVPRTAAIIPKIKNLINAFRKASNQSFILSACIRKMDQMWIFAAEK